MLKKKKKIVTNTKQFNLKHNNFRNFFKDESFHNYKSTHLNQYEI